jgi:hypothetical protein
MAESMNQPSYAVRPGVTFPDWAAVELQDLPRSIW